MPYIIFGFNIVFCMVAAEMIENVNKFLKGELDMGELTDEEHSIAREMIFKEVEDSLKDVELAQYYPLFE